MNNPPLFTGGIRKPQVFVTYVPGVNAGVGEQSSAGFGGRGKEVLIDGALSSFPDPAAPIPIWLV
jgi:hypothetical protein